MTDRQRAVVDGNPTDLETRVAKALWHRFGNPSVVEWDDETHKAEYIDAAVAVMFLVHRAWRSGDAVGNAPERGADGDK